MLKCSSFQEDKIFNQSLMCCRFITFVLQSPSINLCDINKNQHSPGRGGSGGGAPKIENHIVAINTNSSNQF